MFTFLNTIHPDVVYLLGCLPCLVVLSFFHIVLCFLTKFKNAFTHCCSNIPAASLHSPSFRIPSHASVCFSAVPVFHFLVTLQLLWLSCSYFQVAWFSSVISSSNRYTGALFISVTSFLTSSTSVLNLMISMSTAFTYLTLNDVHLFHWSL